MSNKLKIICLIAISTLYLAGWIFTWTTNKPMAKNNPTPTENSTVNHEPPETTPKIQANTANPGVVEKPANQNEKQTPQKDSAEHLAENIYTPTTPDKVPDFIIAANQEKTEPQAEEETTQPIPEQAVYKRTEVFEEEIPYETVIEENPAFASWYENIKVVGVNGKKDVTYLSYLDENEEVLVTYKIDEVVTLEPINEVKEVGSSDY